MNILFATDVYFPMVGGVPEAIDQLSRGLAKNGHKVSVMAPSTSFKDSNDVRGGIEVYRVGSLPLIKSRNFRLSFAVRTVDKIISKVKPDIIHVESVGPIAYLVAKAGRTHGIAVVGTIHILKENLLSPYHLPKVIEGPLGNTIMGGVLRFFQGLDGVTAPSKFAADLFSKSGDFKVQAISNGIDLSKYLVSSGGNNSAIRKKYKLPNRPIILYVGRVDKEKRVDVLVDAVSMIKKDVKFQLVLVGKGVEQDDIGEQVRKLKLTDKVSFLGYIEHIHLPAVYRLADIFVMPGDSELQSIATLEAMACGLPVVGCRANALPDLINHGKNGYLFERNDPKSLSLYLTRLLEDAMLRVRMGNESKKDVKEHEIASVIKKYEAFYIRSQKTLPKN